MAAHWFSGRRRNWRLMVDGNTVGMFRTSAEAHAAVSDLADEYRRWSVCELRSYGWSRPVAFGYRTGTTSTADLAAMGIPIHPGCIDNEPL